MSRDVHQEFFALLTPDEIEAERHRRASLRTFRVSLPDGLDEDVVAHYWNNENAAGHLNFFTITLGGRHIIRRMFHFGEFAGLEEITPAETNYYIDSHAMMLRRLQAEAPRLPRTPKKPRPTPVH